jgi:hypothetical protein
MVDDEMSVAWHSMRSCEVFIDEDLGHRTKRGKQGFRRRQSPFPQVLDSIYPYHHPKRNLMSLSILSMYRLDMYTVARRP